MELKSWGGVPLSRAQDLALSVLMWPGPTMFILVVPGAWGPPRQFTEPGGRHYGANAVLEVGTGRVDLAKVSKHVVELSQGP